MMSTSQALFPILCEGVSRLPLVSLVLTPSGLFATATNLIHRASSGDEYFGSHEVCFPSMKQPFCVTHIHKSILLRWCYLVPSVLEYLMTIMISDFTQGPLSSGIQSWIKGSGGLVFWEPRVFGNMPPARSLHKLFYLCLFHYMS